MSTCKTITISTCPDDSTCDACKEIIKSQCIKYIGNDLTCLGIEKGDNLNQILTILNNNLCVEVSGNGFCPTPQAALRLEKSGITGGIVYFNFVSISSDIDSDCTKTYNILDATYTVVFSGTLSECFDHRTSLSLDTTYFIEEVITCGSKVTKSQYQCFKVHNFETVGKRLINC